MKRIILTLGIALCYFICFSQKTGIFKDQRDGKTYKTVKIGNQIWMSENLNYYTKSGSCCYNDSTKNCKIYGRLYVWKTALNVCPVGWRLPSKSDFDTLLNNVGGSGSNAYIALVDSSSSGFSAHPSGWNRVNAWFPFGCIDHCGGWWSSSSELTSNQAWALDIGEGGEKTIIMHELDKQGLGLSIRCLKK
jgi:uncharacterized protein (TIGR02145 family)